METPLASARRLSAFEHTMLRMEAFPAARSSGIAVGVLDRAPDWERLSDVFDRASRLFLRLRQRVVEPLLPVTAAEWVIDPDFELSYHVRRMRAPGAGTLRDVFDLAETLVMAPYDVARPLWDVTLVEGLASGEAALLTRQHHCIADGMGSLELVRLLYDDTRESAPKRMPPLPAPEELSAASLTQRALRELPRTTWESLGAGLRGAARRARKFASDPEAGAQRARALVESARRVASAGGVAPSPLLARRSLSRRFEALDLPLAEFRRAAKAGEGSLNDAYLAGVAGALRLYHEQLGVRVRELPAAIPISTRRDDDPAGGNHWAGAQLALPIGEADPRARMQRIRELVLSARAEPALNALNVAAGLIDLLPTSVLGALMTNVKGVDVQASNVPGPAHRMYLAGAEVVRSYVFGPLPGPALMTVLYSQSGVCNLGVNCDAAAISQRDTFAQCLREGFDEVLALGRPGAVAERRPAHAIGAEQASPLLASPRLPGTVAEIEAAPAGPQVAAFFDLDGTLLAGYSGQAFAMEGLRQGELGAAGFARMLRVSLEGTPGAARFAELLRLGGEMWRGRGVDELEELGERLFRQKLLDTLHLEGRELVAAHQRRGHTVVLTSSATRFQVAPVARELGIEHVLCNDFVAEDGRLTGEPTLPILWGEGKASAAQAFARERKLDLARSYFYADGNEEAPLMHLVGNPRPTNPQPELERIAARRGWPVLRFTTRAPLGAAGTLRNVAGIASLVPAAVGGLALGALRDKQAGVEFTAQRWLGSWFAAAGVTLRVHGEEHLREPRPAIFIWNHVNNFDALMVAKLIEGKVVSVGKKELENAPIVGQLGKLMGTAFIDRADTASAVAALKPIQDRLADGYSVMIAPEGTRRGSGGLGPFKKGAFRMAMAGGVPIIPIVIRNALDVAPTDAALLRPGTVDVAVLPPVSVADWKHGELAERIEGVRQLFLATLASWPSSDAAGE